MPVIAVIGAGPGLGLSIARRFGGEGFQVALVSRTQDKLDALAARLAEEGIEAAGFAADVTRPDSLQSALAAVADRFGAVDVLEYSPADPTFAGAAASPRTQRLLLIVLAAGVPVLVPSLVLLFRVFKRPRPAA